MHHDNDNQFDYFIKETTVEPLIKKHYAIIRNEVKRKYNGLANYAEILGYEVNEFEINYYIRVYFEKTSSISVSTFVLRLQANEEQ